MEDTARDKFEKLGKVVSARLALSKKLMVIAFSSIILGCILQLLSFFFGLPKFLYKIPLFAGWVPIGWNFFNLYVSRKLLKERTRLLGEMIKFEDPWIIKDPKSYRIN